MSPLSRAQWRQARDRLRRALSAWLARARHWLYAHRLRPEQATVVLYPDRLLLARVGPGRQRPLRLRAEIRLEPPPTGAAPWDRALAALADCVTNGMLDGAQVSVVLSGHFARYAVVPWNALLRDESEQQAYARQRLARVYGEAVQGWELRLSQRARGQSRLACAIAPALRDALAQVMTPLGRHYRSLQPHWMAGFNRLHGRLDARSRWLALVEPGLFSVALVQGGQWQSIRSFRLDDGAPQPLAELLRRERCLSSAEGDTDRVALLAGDEPALAALRRGPWTLEDLRGARPGRRPRAAEAALLAAWGH